MTGGFSGVFGAAPDPLSVMESEAAGEEAVTEHPLRRAGLEVYLDPRASSIEERHVLERLGPEVGVCGARPIE